MKGFLSGRCEVSIYPELLIYGYPKIFKGCFATELFFFFVLCFIMRTPLSGLGMIVHVGGYLGQCLASSMTPGTSGVFLFMINYFKYKCII